MTPGPGGGAIVRRSIQVTCSASVGFYTFLYGLQKPVAALYALFTPIALGLLSTIPGTGRQQAWITLRTLPFGVVLVALGTALAVSTADAVAGMLIVGFLLTFAVVAGPRTAGPAPGLQLLYILACFPPYAPQTLGARVTERLLKPFPWIDLKCAKRSGPLSGVMKPNPFSSLNHFTVPDCRFAISTPSNHALGLDVQDARRADHSRWRDDPGNPRPCRAK
jgi:hypothetical protein